MGKGYELPTVAASGWAVVIISIALTGISWVWGYMSMGAF
jgi:hypothetical protein